MNKRHIPSRSAVKAEDKWNLESLFKTHGEWEDALKQIPQYAEKLASFKGRIADNLLEALKLYELMEQTAEKVGVYASLLTA